MISESSFRSAVRTAGKGATGCVAVDGIRKCSPDKKNWYSIVRVRHDGIVRVSKGDLAAPAASLARVLVNDGMLAAWPAIVFRFTVDKVGNWLTVRVEGGATKAPGVFVSGNAGIGPGAAGSRPKPTAAVPSAEPEARHRESHGAHAPSGERVKRAKSSREPAEIGLIVALLSDFGRAARPGDFATDDGIAGQAGLYSWWATSTATELLFQLQAVGPPPYLLYVGQAGATRWPSGRKSTATLKSRILSNHISGNTLSSTFRHTISAILVRPLHLRVASSGRLLLEDNRRVSAWIQQHLRIAIAPWPDRDTLEAIESQVLDALDPTLNIDGRPATPFREHLTKLRRQMSTAHL